MTTAEILAKVASGHIEPGEAATLVAALSKGAGRNGATISYKVSAKGALSVYGLGRFPVTLYAEQWERLDSDAERKRRAKFIKDAGDKLTRKG